MAGTRRSRISDTTTVSSATAAQAPAGRAGAGDAGQSSRDRTMTSKDGHQNNSSGNTSMNSRNSSNKGQQRRTSTRLSHQNPNSDVVVQQIDKTDDKTDDDEDDDEDDDKDDSSSSMDSASDSSDSESDEGPRKPNKRATTGYCLRCGTKAGEFYNSWYRITSTYHLPVMLGSYSIDIPPRGRRKHAFKDTALKGCDIQPLCCRNCHDVLAFTVKTIGEPRQEVFRNRELFKLTRVTLKCKDAAGVEHTVQPNDLPPPADILPVLAIEGGGPLPDPDKPSAVPKAEMEVESARPSHAAPPPPPSLPDPAQPPAPPSTNSNSTNSTTTTTTAHAQQQQQHQHHQQKQKQMHSTTTTHHHHSPPSHHHHHHHHHAPLQPVESNRQPPSALSSPGTSLQQPHGALVQKSPNHHHALPSPVPPQKDVSLSNRTRELPPPVVQSPAESHRPNGQYYPRSPQDVQLDSIERLQTQVSQNSGALMAHSREMKQMEEAMRRREDDLRREFNSQMTYQHAELKRVEEALGRLHLEMRDMRDMMAGLTRDFHASRELNVRSGSVGVSASNTTDPALELMANSLATVSHKANEVDSLKINIEIMKKRLQRLEEAAAAPPPPPTVHTFPSPRDPSAHSAHPAHTVNYHHGTPPAANPISTTVQPHQPQAASFHAPPGLETPQRPEPVPTQSGWVTVNSSMKRPHPNGIDTVSETVGLPMGSPKRPKLAPIEPRVAYGSQTHPPHQQHVVYDHMDTDDSESRGHGAIQPSHTRPQEAYPDSTAATFIPYATQDTPSDDSWRAETQRVPGTRGRGRGGGPGSRGGRGRKSLLTDVDLTAPEWEQRDEWQGASQSPDGYYNASAVRSGRGILRRGSGGGGSASRAGRPTSSGGRAVSLGLQGVTPGPAANMPADPYAHTKKTRTKPIRNADGILIRKDGRPDMRSQSSAANLRKVHARKEEQKATERSFTPTRMNPDFQQTPSNAGTEPSSPTRLASAAGANADPTASAQKKHEMIMNKIFPHGLDASDERHNYAKQLFDNDTRSANAAAAPRQTKQHHHREIKREQLDETPRTSVSRSPTTNGIANDADVEMEHEGEHQTPGGHSDASGHDGHAPEGAANSNAQDPAALAQSA